jgi:iron complex outermembrane recepter protein
MLPAFLLPRRLKVALALAFPLCTPFSIYAQSAEQVLPTITVDGKTESERYRRAFRPPEVSVGVLGERSQLDTPFSVSSFNRELIELQQAVTASDVLKNDPSVTSSSTPGDSALYAQVRGFQAGGLLNGLELETLRPNQRNSYLFNVERIDLLKGVSSFLQGGSARMPLGGVINYITKMPTPEPLTKLTLGFSDASRWLMHGDVSRRLGDRKEVGVRVNLAVNKGETPIDGQYFDTQLAALSSDWQVSKDLTLRAAIENYDSEDRGYRDRFGVDSGFAIPAPEPKINHTNPWARQFTKGYNTYLSADAKLASNWRLTVKGAYAKEGDRGYDSSYAQLINGDGDLTVFPGNLQGSLTSQTIDATLRGYIDTKGVMHELAFNASQNRTQFDFSYDPNEVSFAPYQSNLYRPAFILRPDFNDRLPTRKGLESNSSGVSLSDFVTFNDAWSMLIGIRRQNIQGKSYFGIDGGISDRFDNSRSSPLWALMYKPHPTVTTYVHYAEGLEAGSVAPDTGVSNPRQAYPASVTKQVELGAKWENDNKLLFSATLFDLRRPLSFVNQEVPLPRFTVDGLQRHRGLELFASGPVSDALSVIGGITLFDAKQLQTGNPAQNGKKAPGVPSSALSFTGDYRLSALRGMSLYGGVFRFSSQYVDSLNTQQIPAWTRLDGGIRYNTRIAGRVTNVQLNIDNLFNKKYWASAGEGLQYGTPRTWRISASMDF